MNRVQTFPATTVQEASESFACGGIVAEEPPDSVAHHVEASFDRRYVRGGVGDSRDLS